MCQDHTNNAVLTDDFSFLFAYTRLTSPHPKFSSQTSKTKSNNVSTNRLRAHRQQFFHTPSNPKSAPQTKWSPRTKHTHPTISTLDRPSRGCKRVAGGPQALLQLWGTGSRNIVNCHSQTRCQFHCTSYIDIHHLR